MDLLERHEVEIGGIEARLKFSAIGENVFAGVPFHETEVEDGFGFEGACAAWAGAEAVDEPGEFAEGAEFEDLQALGFAEAPRGSNGCGGGFRGSAGAQNAAGVGTRWGRFPCGHDSDSIIGAAGGVEMHGKRYPLVDATWVMKCN